VAPSLYKCVQDKMIRAYKQFRKKLSFMKHEKLLEDSGQDPIVEGVTFYVRYLGSCFVINQSGDEATGDAIKSIVSMAKKTDRKLNRVALLVSVKDVKMTDLETGDVSFHISIYRISYCSADAIFSHVFAFIAVNKDESMECHAFLCRKRKIAQAATMTIAQAFNLAFESWKESQEKKKDALCVNGNCLNNSIENDSDEVSVKHKFSEATCQKEKEFTGQNFGEKDENLLIDLNSPADTLDVKTPKDFLIKIETEETEDMDANFSKLPLTPTNVPILRQLPPNASSLEVCAFVGSQTFLDSPIDSPLHGSCLTPGRLMTPACSPFTQIRKMNEIDKNQSFPPSPLASPKPVK